MTKRKVELKNYSEFEGRCNCGCGACLSDTILLALQAFIFILERKFGTRVKHVMTSGARCPDWNAKQGGAKNSRHIHYDAADGVFQRLIDGKWQQIDNSDIGALARQSGLFGGVGYMKYPKQGKNLVHLDTRPGPVVCW